MPTSTARSTQFLLERFTPKQILSIGAANRRINLWEGAVSSGKTVASLWAWLMFVEQAPTSGELVMVGKTRETIYRNALQLLMNPERFGEMAAQTDYTPGAPTARIFGRLVHIIGANDIKAENKIRGMTCAGAYVDEATLLPEPFWDMLLTRMRVQGARIFATTNPDSPTHWLKAKFIDDPVQRASMKVFPFTIDDNAAFLDDEYIAHIKASNVGLFYKRFVLGQWVAAQGAIYDMFDSTTQVVDILPQIRQWISVGIDYGATNPTHAVLIGMGEDRRLYVASEYRYAKSSGSLSLTQAEASRRIVQWLDDVPHHGRVRPSYVVVDPSAASFVSQLRTDGLNPTAADNTVIDGIRLVSNLLANKQLLIHSSCRELLKELNSYTWDPKAALDGQDAPLKQNDHGVDALRYALKTTRLLWKNQIRRAA
ncbi:PBSX family phage terminase large subunit [Streptomyces sp. NPDC005506]|uniref:PBSX family phage terminase large subunit n=1 Tax=Streptomyces sp. NPDC005506 TaxID=3364718 RepID=UPI0036C025DD